MGVTLYRLFDADARLLYVGVSANMQERLASHKRQRDWWPEVKAVKEERCPDQRTAAFREAEVIASEHPLYNIRARMIPVAHPPKARNHSEAELPVLYGIGEIANATGQRPGTVRVQKCRGMLPEPDWVLESDPGGIPVWKEKTIEPYIRRVNKAKGER